MGAYNSKKSRTFAENFQSLIMFMRKPLLILIICLSGTEHAAKTDDRRRQLLARTHPLRPFGRTHGERETVSQSRPQPRRGLPRTPHQRPLPAQRHQRGNRPDLRRIHRQTAIGTHPKPAVRPKRRNNTHRRSRLLLRLQLRQNTKPPLQRDLWLDAGRVSQWRYALKKEIAPLSEQPLFTLLR